MKIREVFLWLIVFVVGSLVVTFLVSPGSFQSFKQNVGDIGANVVSNPSKTEIVKSHGSEDVQLVECVLKFNECKKISETKIGISIKINEYEKFDNQEEAAEFYRQWSDPYLQISLFQEEVPVVLISTSVKFSDGVEQLTLPFVAVCDSDKNLVTETKRFFSC